MGEAWRGGNAILPYLRAPASFKRLLDSGCTMPAEITKWTSGARGARELLRARREYIEHMLRGYHVPVPDYADVARESRPESRSAYRSGNTARYCEWRQLRRKYLRRSLHK